MEQSRRHFMKGLVAGLAGMSLATVGGLVGPDGVTPVRLVERAGAAAPPKAHPKLLERGARAPEQVFRVIIQRLGGDRQADRAVNSVGGRKLRDMAGNAFVAEIRGKSISALSQHAAVKYLCLDSPMLPAGIVDASALVTLYPRAAGAVGGWASGLTGLGVGVAVLDTGITYRSSFNGAQGKNRIITQAKFNNNTPGFGDGYGHGTHVAGIIANNSWYSTTTALRGKYIGVAPEANLINVKVADDQGAAYLSNMVDAIEWVIANRTAFNIRVMNISMVQAEPESYATSMLCAAVERAWFSGIFVVVAAGNAGPNSLLYPPANDPFVLTVGASDLLGTEGLADDAIAPWSSYGTSQDGIVKPDLVAPGRYIVAPMSSSTAPLFATMQDRIVDGTYIWLSGTSMAAPVVAGLAAQLFQAHPEWTNDQVKWLLRQTAVRLGTLAGQGAGAVQGAAAQAFADTPQAANQGLTISAQLVGPNGATTYASSSWSSSSWSSSSWSSSSWSSSSWSSSSWSSSSWSSSSWKTANWSNALE